MDTRIPFNIKTWLQDKSQKVVYRNGTPVIGIELYSLTDIAELMAKNDLFLVPAKKEGLRWHKGYYHFEKDTMCLIRTSVGTPDGSYIYYVETRKSIGDYEEFISISELENLKTAP